MEFAIFQISLIVLILREKGLKSPEVFSRFRGFLRLGRSDIGQLRLHMAHVFAAILLKSEFNIGQLIARIHIHLPKQISYLVQSSEELWFLPASFCLHSDRQIVTSIVCIVASVDIRARTLRLVVGQARNSIIDRFTAETLSWIRTLITCFCFCPPVNGSM